LTIAIIVSHGYFTPSFGIPLTGNKTSINKNMVKNKTKITQEIVSQCPFPQCNRVDILYSNGRTGSQESIVDFPKAHKEFCFRHKEPEYEQQWKRHLDSLINRNKHLGG